MSLPLASFRLKNFKAVQDSGEIEFTPLTVFIGNNGSGKSSIVEGLQTYQDIVTQGLDAAMNRWRGFEYIRNGAVKHSITITPHGRAYETNPLEINLMGHVKLIDSSDSSKGYSLATSVTLNSDGELILLEEKHEVDGKEFAGRDKEGGVGSQQKVHPQGRILNNVSIINMFTPHFSPQTEIIALISSWQFVFLNPALMGDPKPQKRTGGAIRLETDGSNIAEYLMDIRKLSPDTFDGIIETLQYVLPYARDLQPNLTSELERTVYLQMTEADFKIPGWLLSTGTLRVLALLALLRHPSPPPLIVIEEIENGLDPRTIHLIVEELRGVIETGLTQVIITTHSPYLLDLLSLNHIVLVERVDGEPKFSRPVDQESLQEWAKSFSPGRLYTMGQLSSRSR
jgi:predicted ATPase